MKTLISVCQVLAFVVVSSFALAEYWDWNADRIVGDPTVTVVGNLAITGNLNVSGSTVVDYGTIATLPWDNITGTPTTLAGYGITDAGAQDNVAITGGAIDNVTLQGVTSTYYDPTSSIQGQIDTKEQTSAMLTNWSSKTIQDNVTVYDDREIRFGTDNDFKVRYKSADATLVVSLDNGDSMCTFSKTGGLSCTGGITADEFQSNCSYEDNTCYTNASDVGPPGGTPLAGDTYYNNTYKVNQSYDGANWRYGQYDALEFVIGNGTDAITTGQKGHIEVPYPCDIQSIRLFADASGSIVVDLWKDTYANFPPTIADNVTGTGTKPTLSSAQKSELTDFANYTTTTFAAGDVIAYNVDSVNAVKRVTISIRVRK